MDTNEKEVHVKKFQLLIPILALAATSAFASTDFAGPYCDGGCRLIDNIRSGGDQVYIGAVPKPYRICHADSGSITVNVDNTPVPVPDGNIKNRNCLDVSGSSIVILGNGAAWVGPISQ